MVRAWSYFGSQKSGKRLAFLGGAAAIIIALWSPFVYLNLPKIDSTASRTIRPDVSVSTSAVDEEQRREAALQDAEKQRRLESEFAAAAVEERQRPEAALQDADKQRQQRKTAAAVEAKPRRREAALKDAENQRRLESEFAAQGLLSGRSGGGGRGGASSSATHEESTAPSESIITCEARGETSPHGIPSFFPWPPPRGSDEQDFTKPVLSVIGQTVKGPVRLEHVDLFLKGRLQQVGHTSLTYFSTPHRDGYAAITRLEQIDETGSPLKGSARFTKDAAESASLLYNFIKRLVSLPEGRFRLLVFFVSADPVAMNYTSMQLSLKDADRWVGEGCDSLPAQLASIQITNRHRVFLRVYEFASKGGASHLVGKSDSIPLSQHLSALGLRFELNK